MRVIIVTTLLVALCASPLLVLGESLNQPDCSLLASCSPTWCERREDTSCSFPDPGTDWAGQVASVTCKQCTQSSKAMCSGSSLAANLQVGGDHVKAAYCNADYLIIWSDGLSHWQHGLEAVPKPPGTDLKDGSKCLVRSTAHQYQVYKVPLTTTPLSGSARNTIPNSLNDADLPISGAIGVAINGMPIYPSLDASNLQLWEMCEADYCNSHAGKGGDYHIHGDPYGEKCLYTDKDKSSDGHPKHWGWSLDGYSIYGRHTDTTDAGASIALDDCGGHTHGDYGYHYHSSIDQTAKTSGNDPNVAAGQPYTAFYPAPLKCWKGDISKINNFWQDGQTQVNYDMSKTNPKFNLQGRNDYEDLRPCCESTSFYASSTSSVKINGATGDGGATAVASPSTGDAVSTIPSVLVMAISAAIAMLLIASPF